MRRFIAILMMLSYRYNVHKPSIPVSMLSFLLILIPLASPEFRYHICGSNTTTYTPNSPYQANLRLLFSSLSSNASQNNLIFSNVTVGRGAPDVAYGLYLCQGDLAGDPCKNCLATSTQEVVRLCPEEKNAIIWYDDCMLRYANRSFFTTMLDTPRESIWNSQNITEPNLFNEAVGDTMDALARMASWRDRYFATDEVNFTGLPKLYGLMQCTLDLTRFDCGRCLRLAIDGLGLGKRGGRVLLPSCYVRFEVYPFYNSIATTQPPASAPSPAPILTTPTGNENNITPTVIIIVVSTACFVILVIVTICIFKRRKQRRAGGEYESSYDEITQVESLQYAFDTVRTATDDFSDNNKVGQGGFGAVYKGVFQNGQEIAVKRLSRDARQGEIEFKNEVLLVAKLQHKCLVRLLGFCLDGTERLLLYEFVANSSLDHFLFDPVKRAYLDWDTRYKIIRGVARGILYLHEESRLRIVHRDLKASNILLDKEMNPKISDFGMARLLALDETEGNTSRVVGTFGYMPPEYIMKGEFSVKSDVYSFGVLLLEIVSGKKNNSLQRGENVENLSSYAWKNWQQGTASNVVDPMLTAGSISVSDLLRCIHIGLLCIQENVADRPTMASVVLMLSSSLITLAIPSHPAFFMQGRIIIPQTTDSCQLESKATLVDFSVNEASITELYPR